MPANNQVMVEFFGIPRKRAGCAKLSVDAGTIGEVLAAVEKACPGLTGLIQANGKLASHYLLSVNGQRFIADLDQPVTPQDKLLLLSADVGG